MIKTNDTVLTKKNTLCKVQCIRDNRFAMLYSIGNARPNSRIVAKVADLRTLKPFHGINIIV